MTNRTTSDPQGPSPTVEDLARVPELTAMAPLVYVAWADGALQPGEIEAIHRASTDYVGEDQKASLERWLNPASPPTSTELLRLHRFIRTRASRLDAGARGGLVDLGCAIARLDHGERAANLRALTEVEEALGISSREAAREFFEDRAPVRHDFDEATPEFDVSELTRRLDGESREDWERVRQLLHHPGLALTGRIETAEQPNRTEAHRDRVLGWLRVLADEGIGKLRFSKELGGTGEPMRFIKIFEALGMHDLSLVVKAGVQFGLFGGAIENLGTHRHHVAWLPKIASCELLGGFAMTELGHGSNVRDIETVARFDEERGVFVLHTPSPTARKEWIGNAARDGTAMVVFANLETAEGSHGVHAFYVPVRDEHGGLLPGCSIEDCGHKMGLNGVDNGRLWFDHVEVPRENLLDRYATVHADGGYESPIVEPSRRFFTMLGTLVGGRISVAAAATTAAKVALTIAVRYGALRRQFGPPGEQEMRILDYPGLHQRLLPRVAATYAYHFAVADLQRQWAAQTEEDTRQIEADAAAIKALSTWHAIDATQTAREACGGMGFLSLNRIASLRRDLDVFATFEGDNTVLLQLVAKGLLTGFRKQLSDDFLGTLLREVSQSAKRALFEQNPLAVRRTEPEHLMSAEFHAEALRFRTHNLLVSAARRLQRRTKEGLALHDAITQIQDHLIELARASADERVHTSFAAGIEAMDESPERTALESLRSLWMLWRLRHDAGWFLENDYIDPRKARAIRKLFAARCEAMRADAVAYVDAFGIPDVALGPIAFPNFASEGPLARSGD